MLFLGGKSTSTNKEVSEMIGKQTINQITNSKTSGASPSSSRNIQIQSRDLIDPAEIGKMSRKKALLMIAGTNPLMDTKYQPEDHPNYKFIDKEEFNFVEYIKTVREDDDTDYRW
jgi:type IV secretion system protein VirD4